MSIITKYFSGLSEKQLQQFLMLNELYRFWNSKINLISRKDIDSLYEHHVLHSLSIAKVIRFPKGSCFLDAGTGGGFPGLPLAILLPDSSFFLIDSIGKKIEAVNSIIKKLNLSNTIAGQKRVEDIYQKFDFVIGRAVTTFSNFVKLTSKNIFVRNNNLLKNGIIYLKGDDLSADIQKYNAKIKIYNIGDYFEEPYFATKKIIYLPAKFIDEKK